MIAKAVPLGIGAILAVGIQAHLTDGRAGTIGGANLGGRRLMIRNPVTIARAGAAGTAGMAAIAIARGIDGISNRRGLR